jgi:serine/threonine-protein kinase
MSKGHTFFLGSLPEDARGRVEEACERFEAAWRTGSAPRLEEFVEAAGSVRAALLYELIRLDLEYRRQRGESPCAEEYVARFPQDAEIVDEAFASSRTQGEPTARITLTVIAGPHIGKVFTYTEHDIFLVGRSKRTTFPLCKSDRYLSRVHFMVELNPPLCRIHDAGSTNGTFVNGERIETRDLHDGDEIRVGKTIIRVGIDVPAIQPAETAVTIPLPPVPLVPVLPPSEGVELIPGYKLVRQLGKGAMGVVYLTRRKSDGRLVAVKLIRPEDPKPDQIQRFLRESKILRQLKHPHIVQFGQLGEFAGHLYFVMEYVAGEDVGKMLKRKGPLSVRTAVRIISQVLYGLEYAHAAKFVHRDMKPSNLLIGSRSGQKVVKIADFGLARVYQASRLSGLTLQGDFGGTIEFLPPEQITHYRDVGPAADQYATAATLYNLLTREYVYDLPTGIAAKLSMILHDKPIPLKDRRPELPDNLCAVVHRALQREPGDRFPDVRAFRLSLKPFEN